MPLLRGYVLPHKPHPLLSPDANPGYRRLRDAYDRVRQEVAELRPDLLLVYSTQWRSIIGHQLQAHPNPEWVHVDEEFHELGSMPYRFTMDAAFAEVYERNAQARGLTARRVAYHGFPIDTGTVVALKLLDPEGRIPAGVVSCNMYADRAETLVLGKAGADAVAQTGRRVVAIAVTALSNRMFTEPVPPEQDRISSLKDDEWNRKLLEFLAEGRLEDVSQLARTFTHQANADSRMKAIWWLASLMGQHNRYDGEVLAYEPVVGTGCAVARLAPSTSTSGDLEFDEDDVEVYRGDRNVLDSAPGAARGGEQLESTAQQVARQAAPAPAPVAAPARPATEAISTEAAPRPVGAYPHARRVGDLLYLSGVGPRQPGTDAIPGGPVRDAAGNPLPYDIEAQTRAVIENVRRILEASGSSLDKVVDVTAFLVDMDRDFPGYNKVYAEAFASVGATRTTLAVRALPTPIAVELKVIARA